MSGTISDSLVGKMRADLGLTGNLKKGPKTGSTTKPGTKTGTKVKTKTAAKPAKQARAAAGRTVTNSARKPTRNDRSRLLEEIESDIDRMIFRLIGAGGLHEVEAALRRLRRELVLLSHKA
jgi:hypothetical protein